jgi:type IV pilus biogenesis protein CpaD/CtpE
MMKAFTLVALVLAVAVFTTACSGPAETPTVPVDERPAEPVAPATGDAQADAVIDEAAVDTTDDVVLGELI